MKHSAALKKARTNLSCCIKNAKRSYAQKNQWSLHRQQRQTQPMASHSDHHWLQAPATGLWWQNIPPRYPQPLLLTVWNAEWHACTKLPTSPNDKGHCLSPADVRKTLSRINPRKAVGPNNIPGRVLKDCAEQLTDVPTDIFNTSLSHAVIPTCLKSTTIIPKRNHMCPV